MAPKIRYGFWIDESQVEGLRFVKARDGVLESEQIRRAIALWLASKGLKPTTTPTTKTTTKKKTARSRAENRKRA